jgi:hypothetical protein
MLFPSCEYCSALLPDDISPLFCPTCGKEATDINKKRNGGNSKKVNVKLHVSSSFIPILNVGIAYKIGKLKKMLTLYPLAILVSFFSISGILMFVDILDHRNPIVHISETQKNLILYVSVWLISSVIIAFLLKKWSRHWNRQIDTERILENQ